MNQDLIYVGGGNTRAMLAVWQEWNLGEILKNAWHSGVVIAGISAGAICWFEYGGSDSTYCSELSPLPGLGLIKGSCTPHYDGESNRRPNFHSLMKSGQLPSGIGIDDGVGVLFERILEYIKLIESEAPSKVGVIRWVDDREMNTAYSPSFDLLNIGTDVMPAIQPRGQGTLTANTRLTWKSSIAHELVGHREAALRGNTQLETPQEEAQASIRAARFTPSLSSTERYTLLRDGITRLYKAEFKIRQVKNMLDINGR